MSFSQAFEGAKVWRLLAAVAECSCCWRTCRLTAASAGRVCSAPTSAAPATRSGVRQGADRGVGGDAGCCALWHPGCCPAPLAA